MRIRELTPSEIDALLRSQRVARLGCMHGGQPYVVPVAYAYDGEAVYVHSLEGMKVDWMRAHPKVCVEVDHVDHPAAWQSVVAFGDFQELRGEAATRALRLLVDQLAPPPANGAPDPFAPPGLEDQVVLFRVLLHERHGRDAHP
jgi:nitroimidazol reductase NimA-like FMN-containing flavoprotein (pyridoxamine 5'-phosphate oxidase superfamily)